VILWLAEKKQGVLKLQSFKFDVVTIDSQGKETNRNRRQAEFFAENLGNGITLEMVAIPRGKFMMGSPTTEKGRRESESPQHKVTVQLPVYRINYRLNRVAGLTQIILYDTQCRDNS